MNALNIHLGHIARHTPTGAGAQGREAAIVDIAQDLLLRELQGEGVLDALAFKGGTALRKMYAGTAGRFSLDLDFGCASVDADPEDVLTNLIAAIDSRQIGPFTYQVTERRGKWIVNYVQPFGGQVTLPSKLDLNPPPWLPPAHRGWVPLPIHQQYGDPPLPELQLVRLEENLAEKIARLNRTTTARDMYDLAWVMTTPTVASHLDKVLIRRLAVLKIWVDAHGMHAGNTFWKPGHEGPAFHPDKWLRDRSNGDFDIDDIGALSVPAPTAKELSDTVTTHYQFLADLDDDEQMIAHADANDRSLVLRLISELPGGRMNGIGLY
jgi:predicted nucleotidyltransferase component of viral defense system